MTREWKFDEVPTKKLLFEFYDAARLNFYALGKKDKIKKRIKFKIIA